MEEYFVSTEFIRLDAFMKLAGLCASGGDAKALIQGGQVKVNGEVCTMRGKKLRHGDVAQFCGKSAKVVQNRENV